MLNHFGCDAEMFINQSMVKWLGVFKSGHESYMRIQVSVGKIDRLVTTMNLSDSTGIELSKEDIEEKLNTSSQSVIDLLVPNQNEHKF